jgi:hypothetical protein
MKYNIILQFFLLISIQLSAQYVSVEMSIEWKNELNFHFKELQDMNISPAYLNITYRNISNKSLYFSKLSRSRAGLPQIPLAVLINYGKPVSSYEKFASCLNYFDEDYFVEIGGYPSFSAGWRIEYDSVNTEDAHVMALVNNDLTNIYQYIYEQYFIEIPDDTTETVKLRLYHDSLDITHDSIKNNSIDKFIYLKACESYTDTYNLIGFQITGGNFTFGLVNEVALDYVYTGSVWNESIKTWQQIPKQLPRKVGEYELFTGRFLTNQVRVRFSGIKLKK